MTQKLIDKIAVVTGAGSGIGQAISQLFAREKAKVFILDSHKKNATTTVESIKNKGNEAFFHHCDVSNQKQIERIFNSIKQNHNLIDILVNNAGIPAIGNIENCTSQDLDKVYNVNIKGIFNCSQSAVKQMKNRGGVIINLASVASHIGIPDRFAYSMTKGAVLSMTQSIATDYVKQNIRCNSISPARVHTPFVDGFLAKNYPGQEKEMFDKLAATQPIGRMAKPQEIAHLALYLASEQASFITGSDFAIDGGFTKIKI